MSGATLSLEAMGNANLKRNLKKLKDNNNMTAMRGLMKFLFQIQTIARLKLKSDKHIVTSRLQNSIYVQTPGQRFADKDGNRSSYKYGEIVGYKDKKPIVNENVFTGEAEMKGIGLKHNEGAVGTNAVYSASIEFDHDSFLYYAMKHADIDRMGKDIAKELLNGIK